MDLQAKEQIHSLLQSGQDNIKIPVSAFIEAYGDDEPRKIEGKRRYRSEILATAYNMKVTKVNEDYLFTKSKY